MTIREAHKAAGILRDSHIFDDNRFELASGDGMFGLCGEFKDPEGREHYSLELHGIRLPDLIRVFRILNLPTVAADRALADATAQVATYEERNES